MNHIHFVRVFYLGIGLLLASGAAAYPIDGYDQTGIRRLMAATLVEQNKLGGPLQKKGALLKSEQVDLRLLDRESFVIPPADPEFTRQIVSLLGGNAGSYALSVLDLSDPNNIRYAEHQGNVSRNPGSVGKILAGLAVFQALADAYPADVEARRRVLQDTMITADGFINTDSHTVYKFDPATKQRSRRPLYIGDRGNLYEYLDWMMSASSNASASVVIKQAVLIKHFGKAYPLTEAETEHFLSTTPKSELSALLARTIQEPVTRNGMDITALRQGSLFTGGGKSRIPGTNSYATSRELMKYLVLMEQGRLVDEFSSRELKRLLYVTERRIRYASSPALNPSAVYFKSGSLFSCAPEPNFACRKYQGNRTNFMNSIAIVESPAGAHHLYYMVTLMSNVLRKNSALDHQTLATRIHRLVEEAHPNVTAASLPER